MALAVMVLRPSIKLSRPPAFQTPSASSTVARKTMEQPLILRPCTSTTFISAQSASPLAPMLAVQPGPGQFLHACKPATITELKFLVTVAPLPMPATTASRFRQHTAALTSLYFNPMMQELPGCVENHTSLAGSMMWLNPFASG